MILNDSTKLMLGDREVIARYQGDKQVWTAETPTVYGWHIDPSISNPAQAVTYLADAVGKTPAAMGASTFSYGDWADAFFMPKPCMLRSDGTVAYYLDPNDYTQKLGTAAEKTSSAVPTVQGNVYWNDGTAGEEPTYNSADIRCRMSAPQAIPPHTSIEITLSRSDVRTSCSITDSRGYYVQRKTSGWASSTTYKNTTDTTKYILGSFAFSDPTLPITPADFTVTMTSEPLNTDIANSSFDGNAMMEWPLIWYKFEAGTADGEGYFYCSDQQVDESYKCWCNVNSENEITEHFYTAIYNGTGISKMRSLSGYTLTNNNGMGSVSVTDELTRARANNTTAADEWYIDVWSDRQLISALLVLMGKSLDVQSVFGKGQINGGETAQQNVTTGALDDKGLFYGSTTDGTIPIKVFGMENWWGTTARMTAGLIGASDGYLYKLTYGTADGSIATGYNNTGTGYKKKQMTRPSVSQGVITKMLFGEFGYLPMAAEGTDNVYYTDRYISGDYYLIASDCHYSTAVGTFGMRFDVPPHQGLWLYGASLSCKPLKKEET